MKIEKERDNIYRIRREGDMQVPVDILANQKLLEDIKQDDTLQQITNVASIGSIQEKAILMPDGHQGYGMPIGGVAAFSASDDGIISPSMVGFDINCGVRVLKTNLKREDLEGKKHQIANLLFNKIPTGTGKGGYIDTSKEDVKGILRDGMSWMYENGYAKKQDLGRCESQGNLDGDPSKVSEKAINRGRKQVGSLGSGNHFMEFQIVDEVFDDELAGSYGLKKDQVLIMIHTGSRGLGHQVCKDYVNKLEDSFPEIHSSLPDTKLMYAPISSKEGENYKKAMYAAANFAWANRQGITHAIRENLPEIFGKGIEVDLIYDVAHNIAKEEEHTVEGEKTELIVHRKGATRAFPPGHEEVPEEYEEHGQPVLLPGTMGSSSYILAGSERSMQISFGSSPHGAGRTRSRTESREKEDGSMARKELEREGIEVRADSDATIEEEVPASYKDINEVIETASSLGLADKVVRLRPQVNIKG